MKYLWLLFTLLAITGAIVEAKKKINSNSNKFEGDFEFVDEVSTFSFSAKSFEKRLIFILKLKKFFLPDEKSFL
jgi:hypothetical protein